MVELQYPFDADFLIQNQKRLKRMLLDSDAQYTNKKVAILGGGTTKAIKDFIELFLLDSGINASFYECDYNKFYEEIMFENPALKEFNPDLIYFCTSNKNITKVPRLKQSREEISDLLSNEVEKWIRMWDRAYEAYHCPVIQNNFEMPFFRLLGNRDAYDPHGLTNYLGRLNELIYEYAWSHKDFFICDINYISADYGLTEWSNPFYWHMYKYAVNVSAIPYLSFNVSNIIKSIFGKNKKGIVIDLDNTLWGGVVSEDGVEGIKIGPEEPIGEEYSDFQVYLKRLSELGVVLAINSKNNEDIALSGLEHPYSQLNKDDFACIKANWEQKDKNFIDIADEIGLLPESLIFVDDNPVEREIVLSNLPDVKVPEMDNPNRYIQYIDRGGYFDITYFSDDDLNRKEMYVNNAKRKKAESKAETYEKFLNSLEMRAVIKPFESIFLERITQLINKSNQFNLTTRRYTLPEIELVSDDKRYIDLYGKLIDKYGDNGIVSVMIGEIKGEECYIDLWLMSCRVLKRNMEYAMFDRFVLACRSRSIKVIKGFYYPTKKNSMVKDLYQLMGFTKVKEEENGRTIWKFHIDNDYLPKCREIIVEE